MQIQPFLVPDGSYYVAINNAISKEDLEQDLNQLTTTILDTEKTRMTWDNLDFDLVVNNYADTLVNASYKPYATNFFEVQKSSLINLTQKNSILDINKYETKFSIKNVGQSEIEIIQDFMFASFGVDFKVEEGKTVTTANSSKQARITSNLAKSLQNPDLKGYLVLDDKATPCGFFALINLGGDLELHSVAGLSSYPALVGVKKLQLIMSAVLDVFKNNPEYKDCTQLTFSNSKDKVAQMYKDLGFQLSPTRKGIIIESQNVLK